MNEPSYIESLIPAGLALLAMACGALVGLLATGVGALLRACRRFGSIPTRERPHP